MKCVIRSQFTAILFLLLASGTFVIAQGEFAGSMQRLIHTTYKDSKSIPILKDFQFREGSLISPLDDPEAMTVDVYQKGTTAVVFFSIMEDTTARMYTIMDVVEIKNIQPGWQIRTTFCRQDEIENVEIFALVKSSTGEEFLKNVKQAWRFNRDKRRMQSINIKGIDCISEGG